MLLCTAAGLLATIAAGCSIIMRLLAAQRQQQQQQQQPADQQQQDQLCTTLLQVANCHLRLWALLAHNTHYSITSSGSSMRSILGSPHMLQTVQPAVCLAAELLLWPGTEGRPCWLAPIVAAQELFRALRAEKGSCSSQQETAPSNSSSSSSGAAAAAAHSDAQGTQQPWQELLHCPAVWQLLAAAQAVYTQHLRHSQRSSQRTTAAATAAGTRPLQAAASPPGAGYSAGAVPAAAAYDMASFAEELLAAVGVPASELQLSNGQPPWFSDKQVLEGVSSSIITGAYVWEHHFRLHERIKSSGGAGEGQSSSDIIPPAVQQLQQQLLQSWPAMLVELLLLVDAVRLKLVLLQSLLFMLQMPIYIASSQADFIAISSRVIGPLLQLALPHVQQIIKQLRETTSSSSSSTHGASSSSSGSSTVAAIDIDLSEDVWHAVLLDTINGCECWHDGIWYTPLS
jgi:hypothetical protein